ncbi:MAG: crotonase/enoyl-CoA hydratase family protein [Actinomycetia bacterium]|nr:crotonase/enoyl-CoA hydratase family protein [Actinomycetes bacterium]MCP4088034.1 crotonase/enoyl-CoA hydratase family protein [Actinomycetes bacterium]
MDYETIKYEVSNRILTITMNRPERLNAFNEEMRNEIVDAMDRADADDEVRVIIFTGEGRGFCAGADLARGGDTFDYEARGGESLPEVSQHRDGGGLLTLRLYEVNKPMIAAINGPAVGIGVTMTLPMDIRLASESAKIGFVFARRGIVMEACSSWFLPRVVGISRAAEWAYSGRVFPASEALEGGLVREVVADDQLLPRAREIASEIAENTSAVSVALMRHMMWKMLGADHPMEAHKIDSRGVEATGQMADAKEGVASFLEKRPATYTLSSATDMPDFFPWWEEREFS